MKIKSQMPRIVLNRGVWQQSRLDQLILLWNKSRLISEWGYINCGKRVYNFIFRVCRDLYRAVWISFDFLYHGNNLLCLNV